MTRQWKYATYINMQISTTKYFWKDRVIQIAENEFPEITHNVKARKLFMETLITIIKVLEG